MSIEIPIDIQYGKVSLPAESNIPSPPILEDEIEAAADLIADSQQPAIWIGGGAALLLRLKSGNWPSGSERQVSLAPQAVES